MECVAAPDQQRAAVVVGDHAGDTDRVPCGWQVHQVTSQVI
jgi:hypothetical protein